MKRLVLFVLALTLTNCQIEEDTVRQQSNIQTISTEEATLFLSKTSNLYSRLSKKGDVKPVFGKITQEKIINSDQLLTVIPLSTKDRNQSSRIVMLKVKGEIKSVLINMCPEKNIHKGEFSGKILIYDLNGNFINGFRVDNGDIVTQFIKSNKKTNKSINNRAGEEEPIFLNEVIVKNRNSKSYSLELESFSWDFGGGGSGEPDQSYMWGSGGGSGGGGEGDENLIMPPPPDLPISDIVKFLSCLNTNANANLSVFAEKMNNGNGVGHAFIAISQGNNTVVYGYYPRKGGVNVLTGPGIMGENGGHHYDVSATMGISGVQLQQIINLSQNYQNADYDLSFNNCSDFATEVLNIAGISTSGWIDTPNTVANILNTLNNHVSGSNYAPKTKRLCL